MRDGLDFGCLSNWLIMFHATLGLHQVRRKDSIDESALAQPGLTCTPANEIKSTRVVKISPSQPIKEGPTRTDSDDIELETPLQELVLNLVGDGVETDV